MSGRCGVTEAVGSRRAVAGWLAIVGWRWWGKAAGPAGAACRHAMYILLMKPKIQAWSCRGFVRFL